MTELQANSLRGCLYAIPWLLCGLAKKAVFNKITVQGQMSLRAMWKLPQGLWRAPVT